jgi:hypothetical protein
MKEFGKNRNKKTGILCFLVNIVLSFLLGLSSLFSGTLLFKNQSDNVIGNIESSLSPADSYSRVVAELKSPTVDFSSWEAATNKLNQSIYRKGLLFRIMQNDATYEDGPASTPCFLSEFLQERAYPQYVVEDLAFLNDGGASALTDSSIIISSRLGQTIMKAQGKSYLGSTTQYTNLVADKVSISFGTQSFIIGAVFNETQTYQTNSSFFDTNFGETLFLSPASFETVRGEKTPSYFFTIGSSSSINSAMSLVVKQFSSSYEFPDLPINKVFSKQKITVSQFVESLRSKLFSFWVILLGFLFFGCYLCLLFVWLKWDHKFLEFLFSENMISPKIQFLLSLLFALITLGILFLILFLANSVFTRLPLGGFFILTANSSTTWLFVFTFFAVLVMSFVAFFKVKEYREVFAAKGANDLLFERTIGRSLK